VVARILRQRGNKLLKLIEEPPPNTLFLLVAENTDLILNTILSRTQQLYIPRLSDDDISTHLQQAHALNAQQAQHIALLAEGNYNKALQLQQHNNSNNQQLLIKWLRSCLQNNAAAQLHLSDEFATLGREPQKHFISYLLHFIRQALLLKLNTQIQTSLQANEKPLAQQFIAHNTTNNLTKLVHQIEQSHHQISRNANPRILFLHLSIQVSEFCAYR